MAGPRNVATPSGIASDQLDFQHDCPRCGYALIYPPHNPCLWCATERGPRPACWRFTAAEWADIRFRADMGDRWAMREI